MMAKADFGIMTILKTVYLAHLRQGNIEFSRFKYYLTSRLYKLWMHPATHHKCHEAGKNFMTKQLKNFSVLHNTNRFFRDLLL